MIDEYHEPVMVQEVIAHLALGSGHVVVDGTLGGGGHAEALLCWTGPGGERIDRLIAVDKDPEAVRAGRERLAGFGGRVRIERAGFESLPDILRDEEVDKVDALLLDLGTSRRQLTAAERGFSLFGPAPLDMRMDPDSGTDAASLLRSLKESELARVFREYGEERKAKAIARAVVRRRQAGSCPETAAELRELVEKIVKPSPRSNIHPATRTFMALRIAVNSELDNLAATLDKVPSMLAGGGRLVALSYHSLEDRIVKDFIKREEKGCVCPPGLPVCACGREPTMRALTKKPRVPSQEEIDRNPAARSAKLRAAERICANSTSGAVQEGSGK